jgi:hypothetical protein
MKTFKIVIIVFLLFFHVATVFVLTKADPNDLQFLMTVVDYLRVLMVGAYLALFLFIAGVVYHFKAVKDANQNVKELENQVTQLKAKLYDKKETESTEHIKQISSNSDNKNVKKDNIDQGKV